MNTPINERNKKLGEAVAASMRQRHFDAYYCESCEEAVSLALSLMPKGTSVGWGGSVSIFQSGLVDAIYSSGDYEILDRAKVLPEDRDEFMKRVAFCDTFLASANAVTEDGQLVNIDGMGGRVSAMIHGPKSVIVIAGVNKIVKTHEDAVSRAHNTAAPINAQRFDINTPCKNSGKCADCKSPDSICATIVTHRLSKPAGRIKVIIVGENLGF